MGVALMLLQDALESPPLVSGHRYVLFMQRDPFQLHFPQRTLLDTVGDDLVRIPDLEDADLFWTEKSAAALQKTVRLLVHSP